jgi:hypothetical protein
VRYKDFTLPPESSQPTTDQAALEAFSKNAAPLLIELTGDFGEIVKFQTAQADEIETLKKGRADDQKVMTTLAQQVADLQSELKLTPRRASQAGETKLAEEVADKLKERAGQINEFWGDLEVEEQA